MSSRWNAATSPTGELVDEPLSWRERRPVRSPTRDSADGRTCCCASLRSLPGRSYLARGFAGRCQPGDEELALVVMANAL